MTERSLKSISPDGITGAIFALEGMKDTVVLLNGPMGCRFYHSTTSQFLSIRPLLTLPAGEGGARMPVDYNYLNDWFFRQERVPCTYLDGVDYVYGTADKVRDALTYIRDNVGLSLLAIVNSPGASLIGDELLPMARSLLGDRRVVMLESCGWSTSFEEGYSEASLALLKQAASPLPGLKRRPKRVNLLGLSIWHRYAPGDAEELRRLLALCGLETGSVLCADCAPEELDRLGEAALNVVLYPELGLDAARYMEEAWGIPFYVCETPPVGFAASERLFTEICAILGADCAPLLEESGRARALAWYRINQVSVSYGKPRGVRFFVDTFPSLRAAYESFLTGYLGMEPSGPREAELVFADANVIAELMLQNRTFCGIEISLPGMGYVDLVPKTHLGVRGALFLTEQVLNGIMSKL